MSERRTELWALLVGLVLAASACSSHPPRSASAQLAERTVNIGLLRQLNALVTGGAPADEQLGRDALAMEGGQLTIESYLDRLLADERMSRLIAPNIVLGGYKNVPVSPLTGRRLLNATKDKLGRQVFSLDAPCTDPVSVQAWWAKEPVLVCQDSYRPTAVTGDDKRFYCSGLIASSGGAPGCGCGPGLMYCFPDRASAKAVKDSLRDETSMTVSYLVAHDRPLRELFLSNSSFRGPGAELFNRAYRVEQGEPVSILDVSDWPKEGKWAPRADLVPGNNAGILTTPYLLWITDGPRDRMRVYFDILWRKSPTSMNVSTQAMLSLGGHGNLRNGEGWEKISKMQYCTSCHARLDYGMQFFTAFPGVVYARSLVPNKARAGRGDFFAEDIHDRRGDNELTPRGFAELAVAQKEFADAMILDVTDYVFNQRATEDDRRAVRSAFTEVGTLKAMLRVALLRFAKSLPRDEELPALADAPPTYAPDGDVTLGAKLREKIDAYCSDCHEAGGTAGLDLSTTTLPAARLQRMLTQVAFADMPKRRSMPAAERTAMVAQLVEQLWVEDGARKVALQYFVGMERALPTEDMALVLELIRSRSSAPGQADDTPSEDKHPPLTEEGLSPVVAQYTPGLAATTALRGLEACKKRGWNGAELDQCLSRTTDPRLFIQGASPPRTAP